MENWSKDLFEPHLNSKFTISAEEAGSIEAELVQVAEKDQDNIQSLSVLFRGPKEPVLPHDTLKIKHEKMGEFDLFIGPVVYPEQDGVYYEAIFTKIKN